MKKKKVIDIRYSRPMRLWSMVSSHELHPVFLIEIVLAFRRYGNTRHRCCPLIPIVSRLPAPSSVARRSRWSGLNRLHVGYQRVQLFFAHQPLENRHDGFKSAYNFRGGSESIRGCSFHPQRHAPVLELHLVTEDSHQIRAAALGIGPMAGHAAQLLEDILAGGRQ